MKKIVLSLAALMAASSGANAAAFMNGSFETGTDPGATFTMLTAPSTAITGWTVGGTVDYVGPYWQAGDGARSVDLNGTTGGSLAQTFDTVIGKAYIVDFLMAGNPDGAPNFKRLRVSATGTASALYTFSVAGHTRPAMGWQAMSYYFIATNAATTLTFSSAQEGGFGAALDGVKVTAVPEPASWAMMIGGFALAGAAIRRRAAVVRFA